ncbi:hypothetical protein ACFOFO_23675 [Undibacterium arcticum]|uniref:KfrB domain-containing protein n=1 Tax=Undibacterium arcticum TaxID=1762892 RepID=A0ABV7F9J9_9BURK
MAAMTENAETTGAKKQTPRAAKGAGANNFEADKDGVVVTEGADRKLLVQFEFNPALVAMMRNIEGANYDRNIGRWVVPVEKKVELLVALPEMRKEVVQDGVARSEIDKAAMVAAQARQKENGTVASVQPRISDYVTVADGHTGVILAANGRYAAQLTGFGKDDGAAFVTVHKLSSLSERVFKGDRVFIDYNEGSQKGRVTHVKTKEERTEEFEKNLGKNVDGVRVVEQDGKFTVEFDYNPALTERIQRLDGADFDKTAKVWNIGADKKDFLVRAISDMRLEVLADQNDRAAMEVVAQEKIDGVKIKDAFTKDGTFHSGQVLAKNSRYVLQHTGKEYVAIHRASAFNFAPEVGTNVRIEYQDRKAKVADRGLSKSQGAER